MPRRGVALQGCPCEDMEESQDFQQSSILLTRAGFLWELTFQFSTMSRWLQPELCDVHPPLQHLGVSIAVDTLCHA